VRVAGQDVQLVAEPLHPRHLLLQVEQTFTPVSKNPVKQEQVVPFWVLVAGQLEQLLTVPEQLKHGTSQARQ